MLQKIRSDLFLQFIWLIILVGSVLLGAVSTVVNVRLSQVASRVAESNARSIFESFVVGAEQLSDRAYRVRLVQSLGQSIEVRQIYLVALPEGVVDVSSGRQFWGKPLSALPLPRELLDHIEQHNYALQESLFTRLNGDYFFAGKVILQNSDGYGFRQFLLINHLAASEVTRMITHTRNYILITILLGFILILFVVYGSWHRSLLIPLKNATNTIKQAMNHREVAIIEHNLTNQLGELFDAYNQAQQSIAENEHLLRLAIEKEAQASRAKSEFLANMSHELRTPLNSIIGFTTRLLKGMAKGQTELNEDALLTIRRNGEYLLQLINDVLDLSKISAGKMVLHVKTCDLEQVLLHCVNNLHELAEAKGLEIRLPVVYPIKKIEADPLRLQQIFLNLMSNAVKYTQQGEVTLRVSEDDYTGWVRVDVLDTGDGIREEDQGKLFQRFERIDENKRTRVGQGSGLGLSLVFEFVLLHGGRISFESEYGVGSRFSVHLPVTQSGSYAI